MQLGYCCMTKPPEGLDFLTLKASRFLSSGHQASPNPSWLRAFEAASRCLLNQGRIKPQALSIMMWSLANLGFRPSIEWMEIMLQVRILSKPDCRSIDLN